MLQIILALFMFNCLCSPIYMSSLTDQPTVRTRSYKQNDQTWKQIQIPYDNINITHGFMLDCHHHHHHSDQHKALAMKIRAEWLYRGSDRCAGISLQYGALHFLYLYICILYLPLTTELQYSALHFLYFCICILYLLITTVLQYSALHFL